MKKVTISRLFLYKYRFIIGYVILAVFFVVMLLGLPIISQNGLSQAEMESATSSYALGKQGILNGDLIDLPYRLVQKLSIMVFGLNTYAIKLPSILIGLMLGLLLILLLNRWFKNNVSLLSSILIVLSTPFLFLAGSGTPLIMLVFWPTLLFWLGSKIHGKKRPRPLYSFIFAISMLLSIFTPFMVYFAIFCVIFVLIQPHLRFIVKNLPKVPLVIVGLILIGGFVALGINVYNYPDTIMGLLVGKNFEAGNYLSNIGAAFSPVFSWHNTPESVFLSPLINMPMLMLALIGLLSTTKGFFASRNSIATIFLIFTVILAGFNPDAVILIILPLAILIAHGIKYLLQKWYGLFPENPYARITALLPLTVLFGLIIVPEALQYIYGYRYNPSVVNEFSYDLEIIRDNLNDETLIVRDNYDFYKILENSTEIKVSEEVTESGKLAYLGKPEKMPKNYKLSRIITSSLHENSDIIYILEKTGEENGTNNRPNENVEPTEENSEGTEE